MSYAKKDTLNTQYISEVSQFTMGKICIFRQVPLRRNNNMPKNHTYIDVTQLVHGRV